MTSSVSPTPEPRREKWCVGCGSPIGPDDEEGPGVEFPQGMHHFQCWENRHYVDPDAAPVPSPTPEPGRCGVPLFAPVTRPDGSTFQQTCHNRVRDGRCYRHRPSPTPDELLPVFYEDGWCLACGQSEQAPCAGHCPVGYLRAAVVVARERLAAVEALPEKWLDRTAPSASAAYQDCRADLRAALVGRPPTPHPTQEKP